MDIKIYRFTRYEKESNIKAFIDLLIDNEIISSQGYILVEI